MATERFFQRQASQGTRPSGLPAIGRDFDIEEIKALTEHTRVQTARATTKTRNSLAIAVATAGGTAVLYGAALGVTTGSWADLEHVWVVVGPMMGALLAYYFRSD